MWHLQPIRTFHIAVLVSAAICSALQSCAPDAAANRPRASIDDKSNGPVSAERTPTQMSAASLTKHRAINPPPSLVAANAAQPDTPPGYLAFDSAQDVANYREWTVVNPEPYDAGSRVAALCAPLNRIDPNDPHITRRSPGGTAYIKVWVNESAKAPMLTQREPRFPVGSIIVKEKLPDAATAEPELLTVMIKRNRGFNPEVGDWEFLVFNGHATTVVERGRLARCQECHVPTASTDYVFRDYLPPAVAAALR